MANFSLKLVMNAGRKALAASMLDMHEAFDGARNGAREAWREVSLTRLLTDDLQYFTIENDIQYCEFAYPAHGRFLNAAPSRPIP